MAAVRDLDQMLAQLRPRRHPGRYVFAAGALADAGISCNMVAAAWHDHLFVPSAAADEALRLLAKLSAR
jgi:hypothetical protein